LKKTKNTLKIGCYGAKQPIFWVLDFFFRHFLIKAVYPITLKIIHEINNRAYRPRNGIRTVDVNDTVIEVHHHGDVGDSEYAPYGQHDKHGYECLSCTSANSGNRMGECEEEIKQRSSPCLKGAVFDDLSGVVEESYKLRGKAVINDSNKLSKHHGGNDAEPCADLCTFMLARTEILADKGGDRHVEAGYRKECKAFDLGVRAVSGRCKLSEGVDICLNDDVGESDHGVLHTRRQTVAYYLTEHISVEADPSEADAEHLTGPEKMYHAQNEAGKLRDDRCCSRRPHAPFKSVDKEPVESDVDKGREYQIIKGASAVAHGVHDALADVVHDHGKAAEEVKAEVFHSLGHNIGIGLHPREKLRSEDNADKSEYSAANDTESEGGMYGT